MERPASTHRGLRRLAVLRATGVEVHRPRASSVSEGALRYPGNDHRSRATLQVPREHSTWEDCCTFAYLKTLSPKP